LLVQVPGYYVIAVSADGRRLLMNGDDEEGGSYFIWSLPAIQGNAPR
jgi:hypothetical protein